MTHRSTELTFRMPERVKIEPVPGIPRPACHALREHLPQAIGRISYSRVAAGHSNDRDRLRAAIFVVVKFRRCGHLVSVSRKSTDFAGQGKEKNDIQKPS
jgi:hypothetical protein